MTIVDKKVRRDVIPRWRLSTSARGFDSLPAKDGRGDVSVGLHQDPDSLIREFQLTGKPLFASEALSSALTLGDAQAAIKAAALLEKVDLSSRPLLAAQVHQVLQHEILENPASLSIEERSRNQIRKYKRIVRGYPRSPLAWLDLAFAYAAIGQVDQAKEGVLAAISLEPNHRGVVRAASRFFVHKGDFDHALSVIDRSKLLPSDPWLVSAHIATARAAGRSSKQIGVGRKMFKSSDYRHDQISELGAALATNELEHGNSKLAQRIVSKALLQPTENAVAQIAWLETTASTEFDAAHAAKNLPNAWEARTFETFERREWARSCEEAKCWLCDQPFSSRPAVHGSYVAATYLEDYDLSLWFAKAGYLANPTDEVVANNYAVALAETGEIEAARKVFSEAVREAGSKWKWTLRATNGLLSYREGNLEAARAAYSEAIERFSAGGDKRSMLLASIYQAREEIRLGNMDDAASLLGPVIELSSSGHALDILGLKDQANKVLSNTRIGSGSLSSR